MRLKFTKIVKNLSFLFTISVLFLASCTEVHSDRVIIHCLYNTYDSNKNPIPTSKTIETRISVGHKVDIAALGFPRDTGYSQAEFLYGFKKDKDNICALRLETGLSGADGYVFKIENSDYTYNTADPLPSSNISLMPVYDSYTIEEVNDRIGGSSGSDATAVRPGVRLNYYYNDRGDDSVLNTGSVEYYFTSAERSSGNINLASIGLVPAGEKVRDTWLAHDFANTPDRLIYGYVDPNNHYKAYFYDQSLVDSSSDTKVYKFIGSDGKIYLSTDKLNTDAFVTLEPLYIEAGYRTTQDYFGTYTNEESSANKLNLDMVFVPGSYNRAWPYEFSEVVSGNHAPVDSSLTETYKFYNTMTNGRDYATQDMLVTELMLPQDFLERLIYKHRGSIAEGIIGPENENYTIKVSENDSTGTTKTTTYKFNSYTKPTTKSDRRIQKERNSNPLATADATGDVSGGLSKYTIADYGWTNVTYQDAVVMANLLTHVYNINNPDNQLSFVYYTDNLFTTPITEFQQVAGYMGIGFFVDGSATGYRLPKLHEFSYLQKIILDERLIPNGDCMPWGIANPTKPLILKKELLGTRYSFLNVDDSETFTGNSSSLTTEYLGPAVGLSLYNPSTGLFNQSVMRKGYQSLGRANGTVTKDSSFGQKKGYNWSDPENPTPADNDLNQRNGAGLWGMSGSQYCWTDTHASRVGFSTEADLKTYGWTLVVKGGSELSTIASNTSLGGSRFRLGSYCIAQYNAPWASHGARYIRYI